MYTYFREYAMADELTARENEILACLAEGLSNQEIANRLFLAEKTVRWYNSQIYSKLGVKSRTEAVDQAKLLSLLPITSDTVDGKHDLPVQSTPFVGRQKELAKLLTLIKDDNIRLVTILGAGGMGKTRLGLRIAETQIGHYSDGVFFVPLAPLGSSDDVKTTIAENIGFAFQGGDPPHQQLVDFLKDRAMFLILDNFEHLLTSASLINDIVESSPQTKIIVTSRERLNLRSETVYSLRGLQFPKQEISDDKMGYEAVQLFMKTVYRVRPQFELNLDDLDYLARICKLVEGMPLGIELAAGWIDILSLEQIADEIQSGIDILETNMRDVPERHRSVRATLDLTWNRLTHEQQSIFARLSVFRGGFTLASAKVVADATTRQLRTLSQKALIQTEPNDRFASHELLRQFAAVKLEEMGELEAIQDKHRLYFTEFMAERRHDFATDREYEAFLLIDPEFENIRLAWLRTVDSQQWDQFPKMLYALWFYCDIRSISPDVIHLFDYAIQVLRSSKPTDDTKLAEGRIKAWVGWFYNDLGFPQKGIDICKEAIPTLENYSAIEDLVIAYGTIGLIEGFSANVEENNRMMETAYNLSCELDNSPLIASALYWNGLGKFLKNDSNVLDYLDYAESKLKKLGNAYWLAGIIHLKAMIEFQQDHIQESKKLILNARNIEWRFQGAFQNANSSEWLGLIFIRLNDYQQAKGYLLDSLRILWDAGYTRFAGSNLVRVAQLYVHDNNLERATEILSIISGDGRNLAFYHHLTQENIYDNLLAECRSQLESELYDMAWERGRKLERGVLIRELLIDLAT